MENDATVSRQPSRQSLNGLDWLNFFLADVQTGVGPFLAIYLGTLGWNKQQAGLALTVGSLAGIATQTPAGALVDRMRSKRSLVAVAVVALACGAMVMAFWPAFWPVMIAQAGIGAASSIFIPCVCAIALGIVGPKLFDRRQGRNQTFNSAGNVFAAVAMGLIGYFLSNRGVLFYVALSAIPTFVSLCLIKSGDIDYDVARGARDGGDDAHPANLLALLKDRPLLVFLICAVMFHFANAAMLPLLGEMISEGKGKASMMFMAACVVTTQVVITLIAAVCGRLAGSWGRKPLLLIGFAVLPIRGVLYTLTHRVGLLVAIQILDGIGAGVFGVVSVLVIADLTRGTGRFNLSQGAIATAVGVGASLSQFIAGSVAQYLGYRVAFLFLAGIAAIAAGILWMFMPETLGRMNSRE